MSRFLPEPPAASGAHTGILLINLGTPDAPTPAALRRYLREFLSDPRVVELPRLLWWPILNLFILPRRPKQSAARYAKVWGADGSPLRAHTERQAKLLAGLLHTSGHDDVPVAWAMRYGQPDIPAAFARLKARGCTRILVLPLYPQYAASTTASAFDGVAAAMARLRNQPELRFVRDFHAEPAYIAALAAQVRHHWQQHGQSERLLISFHGTPQKSQAAGDPYFNECQTTARLLAERLRLAPAQYSVCFQSRFGRARWLEPYLDRSLETLARQGVRSVDVICPGFVADCLETLEEIALEARAGFLAAGGERFHYIPCLNEAPEFIAALHTLACRHLQGWLPAPPAAVRGPGTLLP